jgi:hypothetical protein
VGVVHGVRGGDGTANGKDQDRPVRAV